MTMHDLCNVLKKYIEDNKIKYNISYEETIRAIKENINNIEEQYKELEVK